MPQRTPLSVPRIVLLLLACVLIAVSWWQVWSVPRGLVVRHVDEAGLPLRFIVAEGVENAPGVVVAHGFSGSQQLMLAYGYVLAHAGYGALLLDFDGHGANETPFVQGEPVLARNMAVATAVLQAQPEIDPDQIALLGHSMGSRATIEAGITQGELYRAVIAISPGDVAGVDEHWPRNLLLMAGAWERPFLENAQAVLARAGGPNADFSADRARELLIVPQAEHITILFRALSHQAALAWLDQVFGPQRASDYQDTRMTWYGVHLGAWLLGWLVLAPLLPTGARLTARRRRPWHWLGLVAGVLGGTAVVWLLSQAFDLNYLGGLAVGGALGLWFLFVGLIWLGVGLRPLAPSWRSLGWGLALFAFLWLSFGLLSQWVWLPWFLTPARLLRWLPLAATFVPWLLTAGLLQQGASPGGRLGWWAWQSLILVPAIVGLVFLVPGLAFLALVAPVIPIVVGIMTIAGAASDDAWAYGVGGALFFSWLILSVFPLAA